MEGRTGRRLAGARKNARGESGAERQYGDANGNLGSAGNGSVRARPMRTRRGCDARSLGAVYGSVHRPSEIEVKHLFCAKIKPGNAVFPGFLFGAVDGT